MKTKQTGLLSLLLAGLVVLGATPAQADTKVSAGKKGKTAPVKKSSSKKRG